MDCTKEEAALVLAKWFANSSLLLLNLFQPAPSPQVVCFKGRIFELSADRFLFQGTACSISVPLKSATFEYEEVPDDISAAEERVSAIPCLRLRLPLAPSTHERRDAPAMASSILSITEAAR